MGDVTEAFSKSEGLEHARQESGIPGEEEGHDSSVGRSDVVRREHELATRTNLNLQAPLENFTAT